MKKITLFALFVFVASISFSQVDTLKVFTDLIDANDPPLKGYPYSWAGGYDGSYFENVFEFGGDHIPIAASPVHSGINSLKFFYNSNPAGMWYSETSGDNYVSFDLTTYTALVFWIYPTANIPKATMPRIRLNEGGDKNLTGDVYMGDYLTEDLPAETWTKMTIPLQDLWDTNPTFPGQSNIVKLTIYQGERAESHDAIDHIFYLDDIVFTNEEITTSVSKVKSEIIRVNYLNNTLTLPQDVTNAKIFDINGRRLHDAENVVNGKINVSLQQGLYIVKTNKGVGKFIVK